MDLSNLTPAKGSTHSKKRIGRGQGSGTGNHTVGKGHNGQKSRAGGGVSGWFEGGQMPLQRRVPKFGFTNRNRVEYDTVNLSRLSALVASGRLDGAGITPETLKGAGVGGKNRRFKILGDGEVSAALTVSAQAFSKSAREKIEAAGGSATVVD